MAARPLNEIVEPGWARALEPVAAQIAAMGDFLRAEITAGRTYLPAGANVLRAFQQPFDEVKVLIVGQDPYPTPGHAMGLSFSVAPEVSPWPPSLDNIFRELYADLGVPRPANGDLTPWTRQGVLLLNRALTTAPRKTGAIAARAGGRHRTGHPALAARGNPRVGAVGPGRPQSAAAARRVARRGVRPPLPHVRRQRVLRLQAVQPDQRPAGPSGSTAGGLAASPAS